MVVHVIGGVKVMISIFTQGHVVNVLLIRTALEDVLVAVEEYKQDAVATPLLQQPHPRLQLWLPAVITAHAAANLAEHVKIMFTIQGALSQENPGLRIHHAIRGHVPLCNRRLRQLYNS